MRTFALTLDLKKDTKLVAAYLKHHQNVWPEVLKSIEESGITSMDIYHIAFRLFMIIKVTDDFSFERKNQLDQRNQKVRDWEKLMDTYQQRLPFAEDGEKWVLMEKIFQL